jgi:hypothetical protein
MGEKKDGPSSGRVEVWTCEDIRAAMFEKIKAHVEDVEIVKRLEHALADEYLYKATSKYYIIHED